MKTLIKGMFATCATVALTQFTPVAAQDYPGQPGFAGAAQYGNAEAPSNGVYQQPSVPAQIPQDDNGAVAAVINSMDRLDESRALQIGDHLSFRIVEDRSPVKTLRIMDSGEIQVPYIGLVTAKDLTAKQVAYIIKSELEKEYFNQATVIVTLDSSLERRRRDHGHGGYHNNPFAYTPGADHVVIFGQVGRQGKMVIPGGEDSLTISNAILQAGGFARFANSKKVRIYRKMGESEKDRRVILVDVDSIMRRGKLSKDIPLKPDDVIIVPEKILNF